ERHRSYDRTEPIQDSANHCGLAAINIEPRRKHDQIRAALERHERWHGREDSELACLIIACGQNAAPVARATDPDRFAAQRRAITHLDRCVKAVHVQVNDRSRLLFIAHMEILHNARRKPSSVFSSGVAISRFAMSASLSILATITFS